MAMTISYTIEGIGIPMEIRIKQIEGYSKITLKTNKLLPGYEPFTKDVCGNIAQDKKINSTDIDFIKKSLKNFARIFIQKNRKKNFLLRLNFNR